MGMAHHVPWQALVVLSAGFRRDSFGHANRILNTLNVAQPLEACDNVTVHVKLNEGGLKLDPLPVLFDLKQLLLRG